MIMKTTPIKSHPDYSIINIIGAGCIGHLLALRFLKMNPHTPLQNKTTSLLKINLYTKTAKQDCKVEYRSPTETFKRTIQYSLLNDWQPPSLVMIAIKSPNLKNLCSQLALLNSSNSLNKATPIVIMMNGMGLMEIVSASLPHNPIFQAVTTHGARIEEKCLFHTGYGDTYIGSQQNGKNYEVQKQVCELLEKYLPIVHRSKNIEQTLWKKLLINSIINPLTTIHNIENGQITAYSSIKHECYQLCLELIPFIQKLDILEEGDSLFEHVCLVVKQTKNNISSMRQDHLKCQLSEIDSITGYLLNEARKLYIELPLHTEIYRKIKRLENHF